MEEAGAGSKRQLGVSFTIDYLLFDKGQPVSEELEAGSQPQSKSLGSLEEKEMEKEVQRKQADTGAQAPPDAVDKPNQSYIALISTAILSSPEKKLLLSDIYQWIMDNYPYFKNKVSFHSHGWGMSCWIQHRGLASCLCACWTVPFGARDVATGG